MRLLLLSVCAAVALRGAAAAQDVACPAGCSSDLDCSLNGACDASRGVCACDAAWSGPCCSSLNLLPATVAASGYRQPNTSTWGGNIIASAGAFHMLIAEMAPADNVTGAGSCGLTTWGTNSQITHVTAASMLGPYARQEVAVPPWSHNPIIRAQPDGTLVLYHIGSGTGSKTFTCADNATSPCGEQSFDTCNATACVALPGYRCLDGFCSGDAAAGGDLRGDCGADIAEPVLACDSMATCAPAAAAACAATAGCESFALSGAWGFGKAKLFSAGAGGATANSQWSLYVKSGTDSLDMYARARVQKRWPAPPPTVLPDGSCMLEMHTASSMAGPWTAYTNASITPCGGNNPGPWVHPNGTTYIVLTDQNMGLWRADTWRGPYTLVVSGACGGGEDPSLYMDKRGAFHCLFHRAPFSDPDIAIGHAFSPDGLAWYASVLPAANSSINFEGLGVVVHGKRERPHLYFDDAGDIAAFVTGVCITPRCNPLEGAIDPTADCSSATQYHNCDANSPEGWYDRTYTLVQGVATPAHVAARPA